MLSVLAGGNNLWTVMHFIEKPNDSLGPCSSRQKSKPGWHSQSCQCSRSLFVSSGPTVFSPPWCWQLSTGDIDTAWLIIDNQRLVLSSSTYLPSVTVKPPLSFLSQCSVTYQTGTALSIKRAFISQHNKSVGMFSRCIDPCWIIYEFMGISLALAKWQM